MALTPETGVAVTAIGLYLVNECSKYIRKSIEAKGKGRLFTKSVDVLREIKEIITEIRGHFQANRVCIYEYSNTETSIAGVPFKYINMTYESVDSNTVRISRNFNKISVAPYIDTLSYLNGHPERFILINDTDTTLPEEMIIDAKSYGNKSTISFKLSNQLFEGVMSINFTGSYYDDITMKEDIEYLKIQSKKIKDLMAKLKK